jgi:hypothetical protein
VAAGSESVPDIVDIEAKIVETVRIHFQQRHQGDALGTAHARHANSAGNSAKGSGNDRNGGNGHVILLRNRLARQARGKGASAHFDERET